MIQQARQLRQLYRNSKFRTLTAGYCASAVTDGMIPIVFTLEALKNSTSGWGLSAILISLWVGRFAVIQLSGHLASTYDPLRVMIGADLVRILAQAGLIAIIMISHHNSIPAMAISAFIYGLGTSVYNTAHRTLLPLLVTARLLTKANGIVSAILDTSLIAGPGLGIFVMNLVGFVGVLAIDCATFLLNIAALVWLLTRPATSTGPSDERWPPRTGGRGTLHTALTIMRNNPWLRASLVFWTIASVMIGMIAVYTPHEIFQRSGNANMWAAITTIMAFSSLAGSFAATTSLARIPYRLGIFAVGLFLLLQVVCAETNLGSENLRQYLNYFVFGAGACMTTWSGIHWTTRMQQFLDNESLARFSAVELTLTSIGRPVGMMLGPAMQLGVGHWLIPCVAVLLLAACVSVGLTNERTTGNYVANA